MALAGSMLRRFGAAPAQTLAPLRPVPLWRYQAGIRGSAPALFSASLGVRNVHFDTNAFVQRLEQAGIQREQADVLVTALIDVINESLDNFSRGLVRRDEADRLTYTQKVDFAKLKSEIQLLERSDFVLMKSENERLMADVEKLKQRLREEITRTTAGVRLDLNLEKGRIRDESSVHALKIKEVDTRIESEIAGVRTSIQSAKFNVLQVRRFPLTRAVLGRCRYWCGCPAPRLFAYVPLIVDKCIFHVSPYGAWAGHM